MGDQYSLTFTWFFFPVGWAGDDFFFRLALWYVFSVDLEEAISGRKEK